VTRKQKSALHFVVFLLIVCSFSILAYADDSSHWRDAFSWFGDVANFVKSLVVPPANYWHNRLASLNSMINKKFAGLGQLYQTLNDFFYKLGDPAPTELTFAIPDDFLFPGFRGFSMDFLASSSLLIRFLRSFLTACCFVFTMIICYHKIRTFFTEDG